MAPFELRKGTVSGNSSNKSLNPINSGALDDLPALVQATGRTPPSSAPALVT